MQMTVSLDLFSGRIRGGQGKGGGAPEREFPFEAILFLPAVGKSLALTAANVIPNLQTFCLPRLVRPDLVSSSYMLSCSPEGVRSQSQQPATSRVRHLWLMVVDSPKVWITREYS